MVPGKPYPKLSLPTKRPAAQASPQPASKPDAPLPLTLYDITKQEIERAGEGVAKAAVLDVVMARIVGDDALFRRVALPMVRSRCSKHIKKIRQEVAFK
jgi:hypothetical protein